MAAYIFTDSRIYLDKYDLSGDHNKIAVGAEADVLDATVFTNTAKTNLIGLWNASVQGSGYLTVNGTGTAHDILRGNLGVSDVPITVSPKGNTVGDPAFFTKALQASYKFGGAVNEVLPFTLDARSQAVPLVIGQFLEMVDNNTGIVGSTTGSNYYVRILSTLNRCVDRSWSGVFV